MNTKRLTAVAGAFLLLLLPAATQARKFFNDDPLFAEPPPKLVAKIAKAKISLFSDFMENNFVRLGERHSNGHVIRARDINTLDEVPDSAWYTDRHYKTRMSVEELMRGPGEEP